MDEIKTGPAADPAYQPNVDGALPADVVPATPPAPVAEEVVAEEEAPAEEPAEEEDDEEEAE